MKPTARHRKYRWLLAAAATMLTTLPVANALTYNWTGAATPDTSFQTSGNWNQTWAEWGDYVFGSAATSGTGAVSINGRFGIHSISLASDLSNYDVTIGGSQSMIMHDTSSITIADTSKNLTINTNYESYGTITWDIGTGRSFTLNGVLKEWHTGGASIVKKGSGTALLANTANTYTGVTTLEGGILNAASFSDYGVNGSLGNRASDASGNVGILFRGGTLQYTGSTAQSTNRGIRINANGGGGKSGGATIDASGSLPSATLSFTATSSPDFFEYGGDRTLTLTGSNTGANTFAMAIGQNGGTTSVVKNGNGKWVLSGSSNYGGTTDITAGTLVAANSRALGTGTLSATTMTYIRDGATLALQGGVSLDEHFHAWGNGDGGLGTVRSISGNNALTLKDGSGNGALGIDTNVTIGVDADTLTASGFYHDSGSFGITKVGDGTLVLSDKSRYTGATNVNVGKLIVNGNSSTSSLTTVKSGATIGGSGTVGALTIENGGIFAPGNSIDNIDIVGSLILGGISNFEINTEGDLSDLAIVSGLLSFGGTLNVSNVGTSALVNGDTFDLFNWGSATGTFSAVNLPNLDSGLSWDQSGLYTNGTITVIPEPSAALIGGLGLLALLRRRR